MIPRKYVPNKNTGQEASYIISKVYPYVVADGHLCDSQSNSQIEIDVSVVPHKEGHPWVLT